MSIKNEIFVNEVMIKFEKTPKSSPITLLKEALDIMDRHHLGIVCIVDNDGLLQGILTDGDIRRMLTKVQKPIAALMGDDVIKFCTLDPFTISSEMLLKDAVELMQEKQIWDIPVTENNRLLGLLHLHPAIKALL